AEIDRPGDDLLLPATRADGLVVDAVAGDFLVFGRPLGIDRVGEGSARPRQVCGMRRDARGSHHRQAGGASRQNPFEHVLNPLWFAVSGESGDAPGRQEDMVEGGSDSLMTGAAATSRPAYRSGTSLPTSRPACRSGTSLPTSRPACRSGTSLPTSRPACRSDSIGTAGSA